jgi:hypothetical protein
MVTYALLTAEIIIMTSQSLSIALFTGMAQHISSVMLVFRAH